MKIPSFAWLFFLYASANSQGKLESTALNRVTINRSDTLIVFYTLQGPSKLKLCHDCFYSWYKPDTIFSTQGGYSGKLLNGEFHIFYPNKELMEFGIYKSGLKEGVWKNWYPNGLLKTVDKWVKGRREGEVVEFDENGRKTKVGKNRHGLFSGELKIFDQDSVIKTERYIDGQHIELHSSND